MQIPSARSEGKRKHGAGAWLAGHPPDKLDPSPSAIWFEGVMALSRRPHRQAQKTCHNAP